MQHNSQSFQQRIEKQLKKISTSKNTIHEVSYLLDQASIYYKELNQLDNARFQYLRTIKESKKYRGTSIRETEDYTLHKLIKIYISQKDLSKAFQFYKILEKNIKANLSSNQLIKAKADIALGKIYAKYSEKILDDIYQQQDSFLIKKKEILFINYISYSIKWVKKAISILENLQGPSRQQIEYNNKSYDEVGLKRKLLACQKLLGDVYYTYGEFDDDYFENSMKILLDIVNRLDVSQTKDDYLKSSCLVSQARINYTIKNYQKAELYYVKDKEICNNLQDHNGLIFCYSNQAKCYKKMLKHEEAIKQLRLRGAYIEKFVTQNSHKEDMMNDNRQMLQDARDEQKELNVINEKVGQFGLKKSMIHQLKTNKLLFDGIVDIFSDLIDNSNLNAYTRLDDLLKKSFENWENIVKNLQEAADCFYLQNKKSLYEKLDIMITYITRKKPLKKFCVKIFDRIISLTKELKDNKSMFKNLIDYGGLLDDINTINIEDIEAKFNEAFCLIRKFGNAEDFQLGLSNLDIIYRRRNLVGKIENISQMINEIVRTRNVEILFIDIDNDNNDTINQQSFNKYKLKAKKALGKKSAAMKNGQAENFEDGSNFGGNDEARNYNIKELEDMLLDDYKEGGSVNSNRISHDVTQLKNDDLISLIDDDDDAENNIGNLQLSENHGEADMRQPANNRMIEEPLEELIEESTAKGHCKNDYIGNVRNIQAIGGNGLNNTANIDLSFQWMDDSQFQSKVNSIFLSLKSKINELLKEQLRKEYQLKNLIIEEDNEHNLIKKLTDNQRKAAELNILEILPATTFAPVKVLDLRGNKFTKKIFETMTQDETLCKYLLQSIETIKLSGNQIVIDIQFLLFLKKIVKYSSKSLIELDISGLRFPSNNGIELDEDLPKLFTKYLSRIFVEFEFLRELNLSQLNLKDLWGLGEANVATNANVFIVAQNFLNWENIMCLFVDTKFQGLKICDISNQHHTSDQHFKFSEVNATTNFIELFHDQQYKLGLNSFVSKHNDALLQNFLDNFPVDCEMLQYQNNFDDLLKTRGELYFFAVGILNAYQVDLSCNELDSAVEFLLRLESLASLSPQNKNNHRMAGTTSSTKNSQNKLKVLILRSMSFQADNSTIDNSLKKLMKFVMKCEGLEVLNLRGNRFDDKYFIKKDLIEYLT